MREVRKVTILIQRIKSQKIRPSKIPHLKSHAFRPYISCKSFVNAVLSYLYGILVKDLFVTLLAIGFDPYLGFYHRPRYGRPALALDMMEEFRPLIADSTAITLFNNEELSENDFLKIREGVTITENGKRKLVSGYERRMDNEIVHPLFGYKISYRRVLEVQSRLLARAMSEEICCYPPFCTR